MYARDFATLGWSGWIDVIVTTLGEALSVVQDRVSGGFHGSPSIHSRTARS